MTSIRDYVTAPDMLFRDAAIAVAKGIVKARAEQLKCDVAVADARATMLKRYVDMEKQ